MFCQGPYYDFIDEVARSRFEGLTATTNKTISKFIQTHGPFTPTSVDSRGNVSEFLAYDGEECYEYISHSESKYFKIVAMCQEEIDRLNARWGREVAEVNNTVAITVRLPEIVNKEDAQKAINLLKRVYEL